MKVLLAVAIAAALTFGATRAVADTMTVSDGSFTSWTYSQVVNGGPDGSNYATVASTTESGNTILNCTTNSYTQYKSAWGVAIYDGFTFDPGTSGSLSTLSMSIDFKSGPGASGTGQTLALVLLQDGHYFGLGAGGTGLSTPWKTHDSGSLDIGDLTYSWAGTSFDATLQSPDFSTGGSSIKFGFMAGNHISKTLTNYYDDWSVSLGYAPVPEPATVTLLGLSLGALALHRRRRHGKAAR